jgi:hypothetical protein
MRTLRLSVVGAVGLALLGGLGAVTVPVPVRAADADQPVFVTPGVGPGLLVGDEARQWFEGLRDAGVVSFTDFEDVSTGLHKHLDVRGPGGDFRIGLRTTLMRWPWPPRHPKGAPVAMLPYDFVTEPANHRLMGTTRYEEPGFRSEYLPDGQSRFELTIDPPASHVGLLRPWNTYSVTNLYRADGTLLESHRNTADQEFVAYVARTPEARVGRIMFDGIPEQPDDEYNRLFHVGQVDDLYVGNGPAGASDATAGLPPIDPRIGVTEAGAPPGPTDGDASADGSTATGPTAWPEQVLSQGGYVAVTRLLWAIALDEQLSEDTRAEATSLALLLYLLLSPDAPAQDASAIDVDAPDDTPVEPPQSALDALPDGMGASPGTFVGAPPELMPEQTKRMQDLGRVWVQLPAAATITKPDERERVLKTATWYQLKLDPVGTQVFYDKKGKLLGRNLSRDPVQVRVWVPKEEEP